MKRLKIYISKSKIGNPDDLMQVRRHLSKLDVEILEYTGGEYSPKLLKSADILIVVLPRLDSGIVGKVQYTEVHTFDHKSFGDPQPIYIVCGVNSKDIALAENSDYTETGVNDWKSNYGNLEYSIEDSKDLNHFADFHGLERKSSQSYTGRKPMLGASNIL